jgi:hypothetical protein
LIELLEKNSPMLIHGQFTHGCLQGCLASHLAWNHPQTSNYGDDAGVRWLTQLAGLNPATSRVVLAWDRSNPHDWSLRRSLLELCRHELEHRTVNAPLSADVEALLATL